MKREKQSQEVTAPAVTVENHIEAIRARLDAAALGPWEACGGARGGCQCGNVWSVPLDAPVTSGYSANRRNNDGEGWSDEATHANAVFIAHAREDVTLLLAVAQAAGDAVEHEGLEHGLVTMSVLRDALDALTTATATQSPPDPGLASQAEEGR